MVYYITTCRTMAYTLWNTDINIFLKVMYHGFIKGYRMKNMYEYKKKKGVSYFLITIASFIFINFFFLFLVSFGVQCRVTARVTLCLFYKTVFVAIVHARWEIYEGNFYIFLIFKI